MHAWKHDDRMQFWIFPFRVSLFPEAWVSFLCFSVLKVHNNVTLMWVMFYPWSGHDPLIWKLSFSSGEVAWIISLQASPSPPFFYSFFENFSYSIVGLLKYFSSFSSFFCCGSTLFSRRFSLTLILLLYWVCALKVPCSLMFPSST